MTKMSGRCMPPSKGSFMMKTSPGAMSSRKRAHDRGHGRRHRAQMPRQRQALRGELAVGVGKARRVVHVVLQHARVGGPEDRERHLVGDREDGVLEELEGDRVGFGGHALSSHRWCAAKSKLGDGDTSSLPQSRGDAPRGRSRAQRDRLPARAWRLLGRGRLPLAARGLAQDRRVGALAVGEAAWRPSWRHSCSLELGRDLAALRVRRQLIHLQELAVEAWWFPCLAFLFLACFSLGARPAWRYRPSASGPDRP